MSDQVHAAGSPQPALGSGEQDKRAAVPLPRPAPPMVVVTKGWWRLREEEMSVEQLREEDRRRGLRR